MNCPLRVGVTNKMQKQLSKKGVSAPEMLGVITVLALGSLVVAIVLILLAQFKSDSSVTVNSAAYNFTANTESLANNAWHSASR